ncbi:DUF4158 domain-containing protein [Paenibacillus daejeonensis]|uniref:DUF4158 domain-containing protein n=1 Tax=Paenibacillus daejeonensis TaxID=135193 RepID=UPI000373DB02|nr:DUF4158 domain-containing protein [Paenibacillus daejeonensis]
MNPKEVLTEHQKQAFKRIPNPHDPAVVHHYTFTQEQLDIILHHRRDYNRLGFAVQLALVAYPGWPLQQYEAIPDAFLAFIAAQLNISPSEFANYAHREPTRREHLDEIRRLFGYTSFSKEHYDQLVQDLYPIIMSCEDAVQGVHTCVNWLRERKIIFPALSTIERAVWETKHKIEHDILQQLNVSLTPTQLDHLDRLLLTGEGTPSLSWLRLGTDAYTADGFLKVAERLAILKDIDITVTTTGIPASRLQQLKSIAECYDATVYSRLKPTKKYGLLALHIDRLGTELTDRALHIHNVIVSEFISELPKVRKPTVQEDQAARTLAEDFSAEAKKRLKKLYFHFRKYAPLLLSLFEFNGDERTRPLRLAMDALHEMYTQEARHSPIDPTLLTFIPPAWRPFIKGRNQVIYRYLFETAVLVELRNRTRDGQLWVKNSHRYGSCHLLPSDVVDASSESKLISTYLEDRKQRLAEIVPHISPMPKPGINYRRPPGQKAPRRQVYKYYTSLTQLPKIDFIELLEEVNRWTGFADCFIHASTTKEPDEQEVQRIFSLLIRLGTLRGLPASQDDQEQATYRQLMTTLQWRIQAHTLLVAQEKLLHYMDSQYLVPDWTRNATSSCDVQVILDGEGKRQGYLCRTMNNMGMIQSTHLTFDHHIGWQLAGATAQGTLMEAQVRYCPASGMSDELFGLARLLGLQLIPRLTHAPQTKLYTIGKVALPPFAKTGLIQEEKIQSAADALAALPTYVREQQISSQQLYLKLRAFPELREAVREVGRIEKTLSSAELVRSHQVHQAIREDAFRWESMNQLTRSLSQGSEWHVRRDEREEHSLAILAQSLLINAIIVWNSSRYTE